MLLENKSIVLALQKLCFCNTLYINELHNSICNIYASRHFGKYLTFFQPVLTIKNFTI